MIAAAPYLSWLVATTPALAKEVLGEAVVARSVAEALESTVRERSDPAGAAALQAACPVSGVGPEAYAVRELCLSEVLLRGQKIAYRRSGRGRSVVLLHGGAEDGRAWRLQLEGLADGFEVIAWDAPAIVRTFEHRGTSLAAEPTVLTQAFWEDRPVPGRRWRRVVPERHLRVQRHPDPRARRAPSRRRRARAGLGAQLPGVGSAARRRARRGGRSRSPRPARRDRAWALQPDRWPPPAREGASARRRDAVGIPADRRSAPVLPDDHEDVRVRVKLPPSGRAHRAGGPTNRPHASASAEATRST
jgi:hypothetical protein